MTPVEVRLRGGDVRRVVVVRDEREARVLVFDDDAQVPLVEATLSGVELERLREAFE